MTQAFVATWIGWTLIHALWQVTAVAAALQFVLRRLPQDNPHVRYIAMYSAFVLMLALPVATVAVTGGASPVWEPRFALGRAAGGHIQASNRAAQNSTDKAESRRVGPNHSQRPPASNRDIRNSTPVNSQLDEATDTRHGGDERTSPGRASTANRSFGSRLPDQQPGEELASAPGDIQGSNTRSASALLSRAPSYFPYLVFAWSIGASALLCRPLLGIVACHRHVRRGSQPVSSTLLRQLSQLTKRWKYTRPVELLQSEHIHMPCTIGHWKPVILLPASLASGCPPDIIESVLAHELAHIRRHDYLLNFVQIVIESLLFFHPLVWWLSARIRDERENCCDDLAIASCGNAKTYANALVYLENLTPQATLASSISAGGGSLVARIRRIAGRPDSSASLPAWSLTTMALLLMTLTWSVGSLGAPPASSRPSKTEVTATDGADQEGDTRSSTTRTEKEKDVPDDSPEGSNPASRPQVSLPFEQLRIDTNIAMTGAKYQLTIRKNGMARFEYANGYNGPRRFVQDRVELPRETLDALTKAAIINRFPAQQVGARFQVADGVAVEFTLTLENEIRTFRCYKSTAPEEVKQLLEMLQPVIDRQVRSAIGLDAARLGPDRLVYRQHVRGNGLRQSLTIFGDGRFFYDSIGRVPMLAKHSHQDQLSAPQMELLRRTLANAKVPKGRRVRLDGSADDATECQLVLFQGDSLQLVEWYIDRPHQTVVPIAEALETIMNHSSALVGDKTPSPVSVDDEPDQSHWTVRLQCDAHPFGDFEITLLSNGMYEYVADRHKSSYRLFPKTRQQSSEVVVGMGYQLPAPTLEDGRDEGQIEIELEYAGKKQRGRYAADKLPAILEPLFRLAVGIHTQERLLQELTAAEEGQLPSALGEVEEMLRVSQLTNVGWSDHLPLDFDRLTPKLYRLGRRHQRPLSDDIYKVISQINDLPADYAGQPILAE